jgi:hypothetical protein
MALPGARVAVEHARGAQRLEARVQALVLALRRVEPRDLRERRVVCIADRRRIHHGIQVAHLRPGARELLVGVVERLDERFPRGRASGRGEAFDGRVAFGDECLDRGRRARREWRRNAAAP